MGNFYHREKSRSILFSPASRELVTGNTPWVICRRYLTGLRPVDAGGTKPALVQGMKIDQSVGGAQCLRPITVLLVEDEELLRVTVSKILRRKGFSVIEAGDGPAAAELFAANQPLCSVVFLDMTLPGSSGCQVAKTLRQIRPDIQIVLTTAYSQDAALLEFDGDTPRYFIRKPYRIDELTQLLQAAAHRRHAYAIP